MGENKNVEKRYAKDPTTGKEGEEHYCHLCTNYYNGDECPYCEPEVKIEAKHDTDA